MSLTTDLKEICKSVMETLESIEDERDAEEFLEGVLDLKRVQTYAGNKWETDDYILTVCTGGPHVVVNGYHRRVEVYWGFKAEYMPFTPKADKGYMRIRDYLLDMEY